MNLKNIKRLILLVFLSLIFMSCKKTAEQVQIEPVTFTFYSSDLNEPLNFDDVIANEITRRTGVKLEFYQIRLNENDDIDLMIVNDQYPDLIFAKSGLSKLIEVGSVIPLDELIENYGLNIKSLYGDQLVRLRNSLEDPSIYTVGTYEIHQKVMETSGNLQIQNAVLREYGYPKIKTLSDFENILMAYKKKYPVINGKKTVGISLLTDSWYWYISLSNPSNYALGYPDDGQWIVDQSTLKAQYKFLNPQMISFYKWLNKLYHEGLLDPESFTQDLNLLDSKLQNGNVLSTSLPLYLLTDIQKKIIQNGMEQRTFAYLPVVENENISDQFLKNYGFSGGWGIAITKDCKDKEKAFKFLDWMCSEEALILTNWGIEGQDYYYDQNNVRVSFPNVDEIRGVGKWRYPFPEPGDGYFDSTGNHITKLSKSEIIKTYTDTENETLNAYGAELWIDLFTPDSELEVSKYGQIWQYPLNSQMNNLVSDVDEYVKQSLIKMILGPAKDFDNAWKKMNDQIVSMGINNVGNEISNMIQMKMELWNK